MTQDQLHSLFDVERPHCKALVKTILAEYMNLHNINPPLDWPTAHVIMAVIYREVDTQMTYAVSEQEFDAEMKAIEKRGI